MTWRVAVTRDETITDGQGAHQRSWTTRILAYPVRLFDGETGEDDARGYARRVLAASKDPSLEVSVEGPPGCSSGDFRLSAATRAVGLAGLANARARMQGEAAP